MILPNGNYASSVYSLAYYVEEFGFSRIVKRNDELSSDQAVAL